MKGARKPKSLQARTFAFLHIEYRSCHKQMPAQLTRRDTLKRKPLPEIQETLHHALYENSPIPASSECCLRLTVTASPAKSGDLPMTPGSWVFEITQNVMHQHNMTSLKRHGNSLQAGALARAGDTESGIRLELCAMRRANQV